MSVKVPFFHEFRKRQLLKYRDCAGIKAKTCYQDKRRFLWALVDNRTQDVTIAKKLHNDFDETVIDNPSLFYLDSSTWVRVCDESKDDFGIRLQLLHLKK